MRNEISIHQNATYWLILSRTAEFKNIILNIKTQGCCFNELNYAKHRMQECTSKTAIWNRWVITTACYRWHNSTMYLSSLVLIKKVNWMYFSIGKITEILKTQIHFSQIIFENDKFCFSYNDKHWYKIQPHYKQKVQKKEK